MIVLQGVPTGLRGELCRWLLEPRTGVFVGKVSAMVRDRLWEKVRAEISDGSATLATTASGEQGFYLAQVGVSRREVADYEGLQLIRYLKE